MVYVLLNALVLILYKMLLKKERWFIFVFFTLMTCKMKFLKGPLSIQLIKYTSFHEIKVILNVAIWTDYFYHRKKLSLHDIIQFVHDISRHEVFILIAKYSSLRMILRRIYFKYHTMHWKGLNFLTSSTFRLYLVCLGHIILKTINMFGCSQCF